LALRILAAQTAAEFSVKKNEEFDQYYLLFPHHNTYSLKVNSFPLLEYVVVLFMKKNEWSFILC
jgi:hypothetical protein